MRKKTISVPGTNRVHFEWWIDEITDVIHMERIDKNGPTISAEKPRTYDTDSDISDLFSMIHEKMWN